ncbi:hypothetical protein LCGC14_2199850 [marine sediment metagenome]|uniref:Uncharacterized protein n=1 Tax=marine sediment metagenome TaxID=412755 RepID=A0A0F9DH91_9ZZZZ
MADTVGAFDLQLAPVLEKEARGESLSEDEQRILAIEYYNCSVSFLRFLGYCKIEEPPDPLKPGSGGVMQLEQWPHILGDCTGTSKRKTNNHPEVQTDRGFVVDVSV